jgi:allantoinase
MDTKENKFVIYGQNVVLGEYFGPAAIFVEKGLIQAVQRSKDMNELKASLEQNRIDDRWMLMDAGSFVVMPGLVDNHVHVNEPGNTEWEGFESATQAAAAGGVTTIVDMPLNSIPVTTDVEALKAKIESMQNKLWVDVALLGGVVPGNENQLAEMIKWGVVGFKCFMIHSGLDAFPYVQEKDIRKAMEVFQKHDSLLMFHAEIDCGAYPSNSLKDPKKYSTFLKSRPKKFENEAIDLVIKLCREYKVRCHIVHLSSSEAIDLIEQAKQEGLPLTAETTFHYLHFAAEDIPDGNPLYKCCPPIRERENREKLWQAVEKGIITQIVSDHSPCPPHMKKLETGDLMNAWGGISSLGLGLPIIWTQARARGYTINQLVKWMSSQTAQLVELSHSKGSIEVGKDADIVIWDPEESFVLSPSDLHFRHKVTPYLGQRFFGVVKATYLRGQKIYGNGKFTVDKPQGMLIRNREYQRQQQIIPQEIHKSHL